MIEIPDGFIALTVGLTRITALWINDRYGRELSPIRKLGCLVGFVFRLAMAGGFSWIFPSISLSAWIYTIFTSAELHSSVRVVSDMPAEDTFGSGSGGEPVQKAAQQLDGWPGIVIALPGTVAVVPVPPGDFMKEC